MGYFSNGTEGDAYEARWCANCVHGKSQDGCAVMLAHILESYGQSGSTETVLSTLIPRSEDGVGNNKCRMFITVDDVRRRRRERVSELQAQLFKTEGKRDE